MSYIEIPIDENKRRYNEVVEQINTQRSKLDEIFKMSETGNPYEKNWMAYIKMLQHCFKLKRPKMTSKDRELLNRCSEIDKEQIEKFQSQETVKYVVTRSKLEFHERQKLIYMKVTLEYSDFITWASPFMKLLEANRIFNIYKGQRDYGSIPAYFHRCEYKYYTIEMKQRIRIDPTPYKKQCCTIM